MADSHSTIPDLTAMVQAARELVFTARRQDQLSSLTVKSVRKQVIHDLGLDETISNKEEVKLAIRNAVNKAVSEELPVPAEKRKRSHSDATGNDNSPLPKGSKQQPVGKDGVGGPRKKPRVTAKSKKMIGSDVEDVNDASTSKTNSASAKKQSAKDAPSESHTEPPSRHQSSATVAAPLADAEKSESELSVLIDESPKKKRSKKKVKGEDNVPQKTKKSKKEKEPPKPLDKDEATIKRLKSFVNACGVRKVWSKEFSELPQAAQQIKRLKDLLAELGMTGKYSMERAKAIKEKRELARELDDVLQYERKAGASGNRRRQSTKAKRAVGELDTEEEAQEKEKESSESEESNSPVAKRKKNTASRSIMAYLANQSSGEE